MKPFAACALIACVALSQAACASVGSTDAIARQAHPRCARGIAVPRSLRATKRALTAAGYPPVLDRSLCERSGVEANQGDLSFADTYCEVDMHSPPRQKERPRTWFEGPNYSGKAYVVTYENIDCWVYDSGDKREKIVAALQAMFKRFGAQHGLVEKIEA